MDHIVSFVLLPAAGQRGQQSEILLLDRHQGQLSDA
jgi:hypothetical protein